MISAIARAAVAALWLVVPTALAGEATPGPAATADDEGFAIRSADGDYRLNLTGLAQLDGRFFGGDSSGLATNAFTLRRVRPIVQGTLAGMFDFNITPDFGGGSATVQDAYLEVRHAGPVRLRFGKFKTPFGLERLQAARTLVLAERAFPTGLAPNRDVGVQLAGEVSGGVVAYAVGVFNGVVDGGSGDGDTSDAKDVAGRLLVQPFKNGTSKAWKGLGLGIAATAGRQDGAVPAYKTSGQNTFFSYASGVAARGARTRWSPQVSYQRGPFRAFGEYAASRQRLAKGAEASRATHTAWEATASLVLTGESPVAGVVTPRKPVGRGKHGPGAIEIVARVHVLDVDDAVFARGFADPAKSASRASAWAVGLTWHLSRNVKYLADYERTTFEGGAPGQARAPESTLLFRAQVAF